MALVITAGKGAKHRVFVFRGGKFVLSAWCYKRTRLHEVKMLIEAPDDVDVVRGEHLGLDDDTVDTEAFSAEDYEKMYALMLRNLRLTGKTGERRGRRQ